MLTIDRLSPRSGFFTSRYICSAPMSSRCPDAQPGGWIRNRMCRYVTGWRCACGNLNKKARENCYFPTCDFSTMAAGKLESDSSTLFQTYLDNTFPPGEAHAQRCHSAAASRQDRALPQGLRRRQELPSFREKERLPAARSPFGRSQRCVGGESEARQASKPRSSCYTPCRV